LVEVLISCDKNLLDELNSNTVNCLDDIDEILNKKECQLSYIDFMNNLMKNYNFFQDFFSVDEGIISTENKLLENISFYD
jgi:hypothetical protein